MTKLKDERSSYLEYQKIIRELEHLNKLYIAFQFVCAEVFHIFVNYYLVFSSLGSKVHVRYCHHFLHLSSVSAFSIQFNLLLTNHRPNWNQTLYKCYLGVPQHLKCFFGLLNFQYICLCNILVQIQILSPAFSSVILKV
jgi:hypothetical protein